MDIAKYRALFIDEACEHLGEMTRALAALERAEPDTDRGESIDTVFRMAHSIKGMAASLEYDAISGLAHRLEDWLEPIRASGDLPDVGIGVVYETVGALETMVSHVQERGSAPGPRADLMERLSTPLAQDPNGTPRRAAARERARASTASVPPQRSVRVRADAVDRFLAAVGELMQRHRRLERLNRDAPAWERRHAFDEELVGMENVIRDLRRRALDIRTTPVRRALERLPRVASELARSLDKRVVVELVGEEVEVDRAVLDHLGDPLLHLVRNAVDHGIESPAEREAAGKPAAGTIRLVAERRAGRLELRVEDDGHGVDLGAVRRTAVERGLYPEALAEDLSPQRIGELLFEPGMSTRDEVSEISGRGVGLDAVKRSIEALGGTIAIHTTAGQGTVFELDLPSMVALQRVLILEIWDERIALAVPQIDSVAETREGRVERVGPESFFVLKEEPIPLVDLAERLGLAPLPPGRGNVVIVEMRGFRLGLLVGRAALECEVFVREVPAALGSIEALGGVAMLPDGAPVFLLELGAIVETDL